MTTKHTLTQPIDLNAIERDARRMRAEAVAESLRTLRAWLSRPRHTSGQRTA